MTFISYAQNQEDVMLWRALKQVDSGFYIDVGASDPILDSVTKAFYESGWRGINIEPTRASYNALLKDRPLDINLCCAAGSSTGQIDIWEPNIRGWATTSAETIAQIQTKGYEGTSYKVPVESLANICEKYATNDIHFLKIDVEGQEKSVIEGMDFTRFRPWILVIEAIHPHTTKNSWGEFNHIILAADYEFAYSDGINRFYVAKEHIKLKESLRHAPNVLDQYLTSGSINLKNKLATARAHSADLETKLTTATARSADLETKLTVATARSADLETKLTVATARSADLETKLTAVTARSADLETKLTVATACSADLETKLTATTAHSADLEAKLTTTTAYSIDLETKLTAATACSSELKNQVALLQNSNSWLITAPLRAASMLVREMKSNIIGFLKKIILIILRISVRIVERRSNLKSWIVQVLNRFPILNARLRQLILSQRSHLDKAPSKTNSTGPSSEQPIIIETGFALPKSRGQRLVYIYVDHTVSYQSNTGVQRVTRIIADGLAKIGEQVRFVKWDTSSQQCVLISLKERKNLSKWNGPEVSPYEVELYSAADECTVVMEPVPQGENHWLIVPEVTYINTHAQAITLELIMWARRSNLRLGFIFYDAIPLRRAEMTELIKRHSEYMQHLILADVVWPISDWSKADLISYWATSESANEKSMPEVLTQTLPSELGLQRAKAAQPGDTLILSVGSITPHKNQTTLVEAFLSYCKKNPQTPWRLFLVGGLSSSVAKQISKACKTRFVKYLHNVSDSQLVDLYHKCSFTAFPSVEEGFGLPILESLWFGKPCICANFGSMEEIARDGGCLAVNTRDLAALEGAICQLINDKNLRKNLSIDAMNRPIKTSMEYVSALSNFIDLKGQPTQDLSIIYYWIDATLEFKHNTGIQRVARQLARAWTETGVKLIPVKWGNDNEPIIRTSDEDLEFFSKWNGPSTNSYSTWVEPYNCTNGWFFMPELPLNRSPSEREKMIQFAKSHNLKTAAVFFDAIPWKMDEIYPTPYGQAHKQYMLELNEYDLVLPISHFSGKDLTLFLSSHLPRPQSLTRKIKVATLAEEFPESPQQNRRNKNFSNTINILCVGTVEPRKNHEKFLEAFLIAFNHLSEMGISLKLKIVGGSISIEPALAERVGAIVHSNEHITWEENVNDAELKVLYEQCDFTVYPSIEEGFGLPILESLWYGKPCISANFGAMKEVADNGVLTTDVRDVNAISKSIIRLASDKDLFNQLSTECLSKKFKTWQDYTTEVSLHMLDTQPNAVLQLTHLQPNELETHIHAMYIVKRPKLSVCISTYNRAEWLASSLKNWATQYPEPHQDVELFVCDNASTDHTAEIVKPYLNRLDFSYHRNEINVGMLGNLRETAHHAQGDYIWILGDDDLLLPNAIIRVLSAINEYSKPTLVYLNYAYTRENDARNVKDMAKFFRKAIPIVPPEQDKVGLIREICARNENFFTAIYTLVFRRDHAIRAYSQETSGRPFSSMLTCIPTTYYVLNHMMDEIGVWIGEPQLVVNMNVSWIKYAPLWILERIPEVYELAEQKGARAEDMDRWWSHTLPSMAHFFEEIYKDDPLDNAKFFSPEIVIRRFKHLPEFKSFEARLKTVYKAAHDSGHPAAKLPICHVFN